jgi:hypothetical protein
MAEVKLAPFRRSRHPEGGWIRGKAGVVGAGHAHVVSPLRARSVSESSIGTTRHGADNLVRPLMKQWQGQ